MAIFENRRSIGNQLTRRPRSLGRCFCHAKMKWVTFILSLPDRVLNGLDHIGQRPGIEGHVDT